MYNFRGKRVLITGGAGGLGMVMVEELLNHGVKKVAIVDINEKAGKEAEEKLTFKFGENRAHFFKCDVGNETELQELFENVTETFNGLDIVINNAVYIHKKELEEFVKVSFIAVMRGTELGLKHMGVNNGKNGGVVINVSSILGLCPLAGFPHYSAIKHGIIGLTTSYGMPSHYEQSKVRVMGLCPGFTITPLTTDYDKLRNCLGEYLFEIITKEIPTFVLQDPAPVGKALIHMINNGKSGSLWVEEGGEPPYEIQIPHRTSLRVLDK